MFAKVSCVVFANVSCVWGVGGEQGGKELSFGENLQEKGAPFFDTA